MEIVNMWIYCKITHLVANKETTIRIIYFHM
jgi:hypothetical protein